MSPFAPVYAPNASPSSLEIGAGYVADGLVLGALAGLAVISLPVEVGGAALAAAAAGVVLLLKSSDAAAMPAPSNGSSASNFIYQSESEGYLSAKLAPEIAYATLSAQVAEGLAPASILSGFTSQQEGLPNLRALLNASGQPVTTQLLDGKGNLISISAQGVTNNGILLTTTLTDSSAATSAGTQGWVRPGKGTHRDIGFPGTHCSI